MPKNDPSRDALNELRSMEREEATADGIARLRKLLGHRSNHVVGRAARLATAWNATALLPEVLAAFERFLQSPVKTDPGCEAKQPLIEALFALEHSDPSVYLAGARHFQLEPSFGPPIDTAAGVRGASGHALLFTGYPDAWYTMAALANDPEPRTRRMAMESLGGTGAYHAELLLRMAVLAGDSEPDITALGLQGLMRCEPSRSLPFVQEFLSAPDPVVAEGAALAIGEARLAESFSVLRASWDSLGLRASPALLLLPMALTRADEAFEFLLGVVRDERRPLALSALDALALFMMDPERLSAIARAVKERGEPECTTRFERIREGLN